MVRWILDRYRHAFALTGYNYPPYYMLVAEAGMVCFTSFAAGQRLVAGVSGWQWSILAAAFVLGSASSVLTLFKGHRPLIPVLLVNSVATTGLFWSIPVHGDVSPLILVLAATMTTAVVPFRQAILYVLAFEAAMIGGVVSGAVEQGWLPLVMMVGFGGCVGQLMQQQLRASDAERREREQQQIVDRAGIAGEVHDVVAHSLSIVLLNVTAARRALECGDDVSDAVEALRDAESQGRAAMGDVRRTIELLRTDGVSDAAQPGLADVGELVAGFRRAGSTVSVAVRDPVEDLSSATGLAVYRVVQESLTNASKHAADRPVEVSAGPVGRRGYAVRITNPVGAVRRGSSGLGLAGMASRVENLGGVFSAGVVGGEWVVRAEFGGAVPDRVTCPVEEVFGGR